MYHFVKFNHTWYLKPESVQDIVDHFNKICGREFKEGFEDFKDNTVLKKDPITGGPMLYSLNHTSSVWRMAVQHCAMDIKGIGWLEAATELEQKTFSDRVEMFNKGRAIYLRDGLPYYCSLEHPNYDEEKWSEILEYPYGEFKYDDVRFIQWPDGRHWYAKCGKIDIVDKYGRQKWSDKSYAQKVAKEWCMCGGDWSKLESN